MRPPRDRPRRRSGRTARVGTGPRAVRCGDRRRVPRRAVRCAPASRALLAAVPPVLMDTDQGPDDDRVPDQQQPVEVEIQVEGERGRRTVHEDHLEGDRLRLPGPAGQRSQLVRQRGQTPARHDPPDRERDGGQGRGPGVGSRAVAGARAGVRAGARLRSSLRIRPFRHRAHARRGELHERQRQALAQGIARIVERQQLVTRGTDERRQCGGHLMGAADRPARRSESLHRVPSQCASRQRRPVEYGARNMCHG